MTKYVECPNCQAPLVAALIWEDDEVIEYRAVCYTPECGHPTLYVNKNKITGEVDPAEIKFVTKADYEAFMDAIERGVF